MAAPGRARQRVWGLLSATALSFGIVAAQEKTASPIPLEKGTRWVYEANVKWTPVAGSGLTGVQSNRTEWTSEVLDCVQGGFACAAVVRAFPMDILGMDPETPKGYTVLVATSNRLYAASAANAGKAAKLARRFAAKPQGLAGQAQLLLDLPLHANKRWGGDDETVPRTDGWYCWRVEAVRTQTLIVRGLSPEDYFSVWTVAYRTCPDHQVIDIAPGVGIIRLDYDHHGTVACEDVRLVEFKRASDKPKPAAPKKRPQ